MTKRRARLNDDNDPLSSTDKVLAGFEQISKSTSQEADKLTNQPDKLLTSQEADKPASQQDEVSTSKEADKSTSQPDKLLTSQKSDN